MTTEMTSFGEGEFGFGPVRNYAAIGIVTGIVLGATIGVSPTLSVVGLAALMFVASAAFMRRD